MTYGVLSAGDYFKEIRKFTTSQYWYTGLRITAGVMLPTLVLEHYNWLTEGMPFLWGALFVAITDAPGPIHHRRNGLLAAVGINTAVVIVTLALRNHQPLVVAELILFTFFFSLFGIFGNRANAVGTLGIVMMILNLVSRTNPVSGDWLVAILTFGGGIWYTGFSLLLYGIRPYKLAEQAIGENLIAIAGYFKARANLYDYRNDIAGTFNDLMHEQSTVLKSQDQAREILFKTRQFVADSSPRSRSMMMIFFDAADLLEQTMATYQDYSQLRDTLKDTDLLEKFRVTAVAMASELERIGYIVQSGAQVREDVSFNLNLYQLEVALQEFRVSTRDETIIESVKALERTLANMRRISNLLQRLVMYTRLEGPLPESYSSVINANKIAVAQPITLAALFENLTFKSNTFRHAFRLTTAVIIGYSVSFFLSLSHVYWVLLTIVTVLRPVYAISRQRNIQRVAGTLVGAIIAIGVLYFVSGRAYLLAIMICSMVMSYSLFRVNYFSFVLFLTIYVIITFHFLNPADFRTLIEERLLDTVIGSVIAALTARFIIPVWGREEIRNNMIEMVKVHRQYLDAAWDAVIAGAQSDIYRLARKDAVVALTNLSDNFQHILSEPSHTRRSEQLHQFVIANHLLMGYLVALSREKISKEVISDPAVRDLLKSVHNELRIAEANLVSDRPEPAPMTDERYSTHGPATLLMIDSLAREIAGITYKFTTG
ncbi:MAG TPA: FUSC family membrane protein [Cyclobacteriaceae bacterium]|nr:FUSC family membrane protein [Cyclobacteriaceae bacterium]